MTQWNRSLMILSEEQNKMNKALSTIGICVKAGKVIFGIPLICEALKNNERNAPILVVTANDISQNSKKRITDRCRFYSVEQITLPVCADELGRAVGKGRAVGAIGITDKNLSTALLTAIEKAQK